jgi:mannonate dehydratase
LTWEALENFDPAHWYDVLQDGPEKENQMEDLKKMIRNIGRAGIPVLGYYFSLAGVWGWNAKPKGRGAANAVGFDKEEVDTDRPIPHGMVWNMIYDTQAKSGNLDPVDQAEIWERFEYFLKRVIPVAEENGVVLAAHADDPPLPELRKTARLFYNAKQYDKLFDVVDSKHNAMEFCMGTVQEMQGSDIYESLDKYTRKKKIAYIHFRNVKGKVPNYREVFIDEGDIDMIRALKILKRNNYNGVLIPDHTPEMSCGAPWHAGMAYALGYMNGALQTIDKMAAQ